MATNESDASGESRWETGDSLSQDNLNTADARSNAADYVERGCGFTVDLNNNTCTIGNTNTPAGNYVRVEGTRVLWKLYPSQTTVDLPDTNGTNHVFIARGDFDSDGSDEVYYHVDTDDSAPSDPSLKIGTVDTSAGSASDAPTESNRDPLVSAREVITDNVDSDKRAASFATIQGAIDSSPIGGRTIVPYGTFSETITLRKAVVKGSGISTQIEGSGAHTVATNRDDGGLREIWVDQVDNSGSFDAINISNAEVVIGPQVDVDFAPRYGINIGGTRSKIIATDIQGGQVACIHIQDETQAVHLDEVLLWGPPGKGLVVSGNLAKFCDLDVTIRQPSGVGAEIAGFDHDLAISVNDALGARAAEISANNCDGFVSARSANNDGVLISGDKNNLRVSEDATSGTGIHVTGSENILTCQSKNSIDVDGNDNTIFAPPSATVDTTGGTNNSVYQ